MCPIRKSCWRRASNSSAAGSAARSSILARRATDPDPKVRRELAESLPSLPGIDAKPWLLELSYDENAASAGDGRYADGHQRRFGIGPPPGSKLPATIPTTTPAPSREGGRHETTRLNHCERR